MNRGRIVALRAAAAGAVVPFLMMAGCGMNATPQPPSLKLPAPVTDLSGARVGDEVHLHWTMPKRDTDKVILKGDQRARICRRVETGACQTAGELMIAPAAPADFVDHIPAALATGSPRLLTYLVELENHAGHNAGPSNPVHTATGPTLPKIEDFSAAATQDGVVLKWKPEANTELIRIHRSLVVDPKRKQSSQMAGSPAPPEQTLEVSAPDQGQALDRDAALDNVYRYSAQRMRKFTLEGHVFEVTSVGSDVVTLNARDVFAPRTPTGLQAVADPDAKVIDLSWSPNTENDLAGYAVYRRDAGSASNPVRVSPPGVVAPSFRDASSLPGHSYAYSVSAIDRDGNESPRSADVEETLPQQ
jgi:hypothetical protein